MVYDQVAFRVSFILFGEDVKRVKIEYDEYGSFVITIDLHGYKVSEAKNVICGIMKVINVPFRLELIHGYSHGTAIKEYIHNVLCDKRIVEKYCYPDNPGRTILTIN